MIKKGLMAALSFVAVLALAACSSGGGGGGTNDKVTLTMWMYGGCTGCVEKPLIAAFHKANPNITIKLVEEPGDTYFAQLKSASLTKTGPDLASMFAGTYMTQFQRYFVDEKKYLPSKQIDQAPSIDYFSKDNTRKNAIYAVPNADQFYIGYYNKKIFAANGITSAPTTWDELNADAAILKKAGVLPIVNGAMGGGAQMAPIFEWAYLAAGLPLADWTKLLNGTLPYDNPTLVAQLTKWNALYKDGYLNKDAFNDPNTQSTFTSGKAAMLLGDGSWDLPAYEKALGADLGVIAPPYSDSTTTHPLIQTAGNGYAIMNYSKNQDAAGKFVAFMLGDAGQKIVAASGQPAIRPGFPTSLAAQNELTALSAASTTAHYPMFDNFSQSGVTTAITSNIGQVLVGQKSPTSALQALDGAFKALPADQKDSGVIFK